MHYKQYESLLEFYSKGEIIKASDWYSGNAHSRRKLPLFCKEYTRNSKLIPKKVKLFFIDNPRVKKALVLDDNVKFLIDKLGGFND